MVLYIFREKMLGKMIGVFDKVWEKILESEKEIKEFWMLEMDVKWRVWNWLNRKCVLRY